MADRMYPPTKEDLLKLTRWARVAFAGRCAQRVQPIFLNWARDYRPSRQTVLVHQLERMIASATASARNAYADLGAHMEIGRVEPQGFLEAHTAAREAPARVAYSAARAGNYAGDAAEFAARSVLTSFSTGEAVAEAAAHAAHSAAAAASEAYAAAYEFNLAAMWSDYDRLFALANEDVWTDESPVDPDWLGPLWPQGKPEGWPDDPNAAEQPAGLSLTIEVPDNWTDEQITAKVREVVDKLDTAYRQLGGRDGLRLLPPTDVTVPVEVLTGVGA